jgi:hypothetical protein
MTPSGKREVRSSRLPDRVVTVTFPDGSSRRHFESEIERTSQAEYDSATQVDNDSAA